MRQRLFHFRNKKIKIKIYKVYYVVDDYLLVFSAEDKYGMLYYSSVDLYSELAEDIEEYLPKIKSKPARRKLRDGLDYINYLKKRIEL